MTYNPYSINDPYSFPWDQPPIKKPDVRVELVRIPLFYTVNWKIIVYVDDEEKWWTHEEPTRPTHDEVKAWIADLIINNYSIMKMLNIDIAKFYKSVGGDPEEIMWF